MQRAKNKRKSRASEKYTIELAHVVGSTAKSSCSCSVDPNSGLVAYPSGCTVVLYDPKTGTQSHIISNKKKQIRSLHFSSDGQYLVTGEQGSKPCARIYSVAQRTQIFELEESFSLEISCVQFSPDMRHIVGIGSEHDRAVQVWAAKKRGWPLVWNAKMNQSTVAALAFSPDSSCALMVGKRYIKILTIYKTDVPPAERRNSTNIKPEASYMLRGVMLGEYKYSKFVDVSFGPDGGKFAYAIAPKVIVKISIDQKAVLQAFPIPDEGGQSLNVIGDRILWGTATGKLKLNTCDDLSYIKDVQYTPRSEGRRIICSYADTVNKFLYLFFDDHSVETYKVEDYEKSVQLYAVIDTHSESLWDVKCIPGKVEDKETTTFVSCSADGKAMIWKYNDEKCELLHTQYCMTTSKSPSTPDESPQQQSASSASSGGKSAYSGFRSLAVSQDGSTIAIGDFCGNINIFDIETKRSIGNVVSKNITSSIHTLAFYQPKNLQWPSLFASAGRDRVVNLYNDKYEIVTVISDHSSTVTGVEFFELENEVRLITCGYDRSLHFYSLSWMGEEWQMDRFKQKQNNVSITCMNVTSEGNVFASAGSSVHEYDVRSTELKRTIPVDVKFSTIMCLAVNKENTLLAAASGKEGIFIYHLVANQTVACLKGHSEHAHSMAFDGDHRFLSAAGDSCLFVWNIKQVIMNNGNSESSHHFSRADDTPTEPLTPSSGSECPMLDVNEVMQQLHENTAKRKGSSTVWMQEIVNNDDYGDDEDDDLNEAFRTRSNTIPTIRRSIGKWGHNLEKDKICEGIESLSARDESSDSLEGVLEVAAFPQQSYLEKLALLTDLPNDFGDDENDDDADVTLLAAPDNNNDNNNNDDVTLLAAPDDNDNNNDDVTIKPKTEESAETSSPEAEKSSPSVDSSPPSSSGGNACDDVMVRRLNVDDVMVRRLKVDDVNENLIMFTSDEERARLSAPAISPSPPPSASFEGGNNEMTSSSATEDDITTSPPSDDKSADDEGETGGENSGGKFPPAFQELLQSLSLRKPANRKPAMLVNKKKKKKKKQICTAAPPRRPNSLNGLKCYSRSSPADSDEDDDGGDDDDEELLNNNGQRSRADKMEEWKECCQQLLARFSDAEKLYHQEKLLNDNSMERNEAMRGIVGTFTNIATRIAQLNLLHTTDDDGGGTPFDGILREYSDRLVKLVSKQVDTTSSL